MGIRKTQWVVAPSIETAEYYAMEETRVTRIRAHVFADHDEALRVAAARQHPVFKFTYSLLLTVEPAREPAATAGGEDTPLE